MSEEKLPPIESIEKSPYSKPETQANLRRLSFGVSAFSFAVLMAMALQNSLHYKLENSAVFFAAAIPFGLASWYCTQTLPVLKFDLQNVMNCKPLILNILFVALFSLISCLLCFIGILLMIHHVNPIAAWVSGGLSVFLFFLVIVLKLLIVGWDNVPVLRSKLAEAKDDSK